MSAEIGLIVTLLAGWRLTSLVSRERGLFAVGMRLRALFGVHHLPDGTPAYDAEYDEVLLNSVSRFQWVNTLAHEIAQGMTCLYCCSVWIGIAFAVLMPVMDGWLVQALATSAGIILLDRLIGKAG